MKRPIHQLLVISGLAAVPLFGAYVSSYALWETASGELVTGLQSGWGDLLVHLRAAIFFAEQGGWPRESFFLSGEPVGYAFFVDSLSGMLWRTGVPIATALALPTMLLTVSFLGGIEWLVWYLTQSRLAAIFGAALFVGFGGISGWVMLPEILSAPSPWAALRTLPHGVTAWHEANLVVLNPFVMMLHQRSYLVGFPLFLFLLFLVGRFLQRGSPLLLLGITAGGLTLAFFHPFTWLAFLLLLPASFAWAAVLRLRSYTVRDLLWCACTMLILGVGGFLIVRALQPHASVSTIRWHPGWLAPGFSWGAFWAGNLGLFLLLAPVVVRHLMKQHRSLAVLILASLVLFGAGNLFLFAPWDFDNTKVFAPVWVLFSMGTGVFLASVWHRRRLGGKVAVGGLLIVLVWSGGMEIVRVFTHRAHPLALSDQAGQQAGEAVRRHARPRDTILTAPTPNHPVFLFSGRPSFVAYEGWLWSQGWGGRYEERFADVRKMYAGTPESPELFRKHRIAFVVVGPPEEAYGADAEWFQRRYPLLLSLHNYRVYDVRPATH